MAKFATSIRFRVWAHKFFLSLGEIETIANWSGSNIEQRYEVWYWADASKGGKIVRNEDVYLETEDGTGKWVRYNEKGIPVKGWTNIAQLDESGNQTRVWYYFDMETCARAHGLVEIDGRTHLFDEETGILLDQVTGKPLVATEEDYEYLMSTMGGFVTYGLTTVHYTTLDEETWQ